MEPLLLVLPSDSNKHTHPRNRANDYVVDLVDIPLNAGGLWELAIQSVIYPSGWTGGDTELFMATTDITIDQHNYIDKEAVFLWAPDSNNPDRGSPYVSDVKGDLMWIPLRVGLSRDKLRSVHIRVLNTGTGTPAAFLPGRKTSLIALLRNRRM
jgi:hypothetical protein